MNMPLFQPGQGSNPRRRVEEVLSGLRQAMYIELVADELVTWYISRAGKLYIAAHNQQVHCARTLRLRVRMQPFGLLILFARDGIECAADKTAERHKLQMHT